MFHHSQHQEKKRIRASIACDSCRAKRSKCSIEPGRTECEQCRRNDTKCVIETTDRRRR
ncbi:hypothetical protein BDV18DRAFT_149157 [Aspergillus unguis]